LNLGIRYEYNSPAYLKSGLTSTIIDQGNGLFGANRTPAAGGQLMNNWLTPGGLYLAGYGNSGNLRCELGFANPNGLPASTCDPQYMTNVEFVGPNSPNPGRTVIPRDRNNFGPAVGFSWNLPWFGEGKTTLRGGYSIQFSRVNVSEGTLASALGGASEPSTTFGGSTGVTSAIAGIAAGRAVSITDLPTLVPLNIPVNAPGQAIPIYTRSASVQAYAPDFVTPYTQNLNMSVTRSLTRSMTLDLRYVGTLARKQSGSLNLNTNTVLYNPELFAAFEAARRGENPKLLDDILMGLRLPGVPTAYGSTTGMVNGVDAFGGGQLRMSTASAGFGQSSIRTLLANGDFVGLANLLMQGTSGFGGLAGTAGLQTAGQPTNSVGNVIRNGCNRIANGVTSVGTFTNRATRCFPENYLIANPQLNSATYNANLRNTNYHALQVQFSLRPIQGVSFQSTYSLAKSLGTPSSGFTDPLNRDFDYSAGGGNLTSTEPKHTFRMNGTFELPIGPNKLLFGNTSGWVARLMEKWSTSIILNLQSGSYYTIDGAQTTRYANGRYNPTVNWKIPKGQVEWVGGTTAQYFGTSFFTEPDPQCLDASLIAQVADPVTTGTAPTPLSGFCNMDALGMVVPAGTVGSYPRSNGEYGALVLVNPRPGEFGMLSPSILEGPGSYTVNANMGKTFRLTETKQLTIRMDATNILNHPAPNPVSTDVGGAFGSDFGEINGKGGTPRNFQASVRLTF
jgi:hypothetical protein